MGITAESTTRAFKQPSVDELASRVKPDPVPVKHIFVAIDPSGGGESAFGIASIACLQNGDTMVRVLSLLLPPLSLILLIGGCNDVLEVHDAVHRGGCLQRRKERQSVEALQLVVGFRVG